MFYSNGFLIMQVALTWIHKMHLFVDKYNYHKFEKKNESLKINVLCLKRKNI